MRRQTDRRRRTKEKRRTNTLEDRENAEEIDKAKENERRRKSKHVTPSQGHQCASACIPGPISATIPAIAAVL